MTGKNAFHLQSHLQRLEKKIGWLLISKTGNGNFLDFDCCSFHLSRCISVRCSTCNIPKKCVFQLGCSAFYYEWRRSSARAGYDIRYGVVYGINKTLLLDVAFSLLASTSLKFFYTSYLNIFSVCRFWHSDKEIIPIWKHRDADQVGAREFSWNCHSLLCKCRSSYCVLIFK